MTNLKNLNLTVSQDQSSVHFANISNPRKRESSKHERSKELGFNGQSCSMQRGFGKHDRPKKLGLG